MKLYHAAPLSLEPGSVITPGNWGRLIRRYTASNLNQLVFMRETIFEGIRGARFPNKPSRMNAAFAFETLNDAKTHQTTAAQLSVLHVVELVQPSLPTYRADYSLITNPDGAAPLWGFLEDHAVRYWSGASITTPEVVTHSALRVLAIIP